ncbi:41807_t:CDS:1, partial [Gigaspora margarita]
LIVFDADNNPLLNYPSNTMHHHHKVSIMYCFVHYRGRETSRKQYQLCAIEYWENKKILDNTISSYFSSGGTRGELNMLRLHIDRLKSNFSFAHPSGGFFPVIYGYCSFFEKNSQQNFDWNQLAQDITKDAKSVTNRSTFIQEIQRLLQQNDNTNTNIINMILTKLNIKFNENETDLEKLKKILKISTDITNIK